MKSDPISFRVDVIPTGKGRPRAALRGKHVSLYTPAKTERAERDFIALADAHKPAAPLSGPLDVSLVFWLPIPLSWPAWRQEAARCDQIQPRGPKDIDNLAKLVLDAINRSGAFWVDDAQVFALTATKHYGARPGVEVSIAEVAEVASAAEWKARTSARTSAAPRGPS